MAAHDWDQHYESGELPWDSDAPDAHLVELVEQGVIAPGRALDVGCGTGTNAIWLASRGFEVHALDIAPRAIERAQAKKRTAGVDVKFAVLDFLSAAPAGGPFDFVFDRGVFHVFDAPEERARFAERVAALLAARGQWLCLAGSTEGPAREYGPPRRSARDLLLAVEPVLELSLLRSITFDLAMPSAAKAWLMLARARELPAQPSTT